MPIYLARFAGTAGLILLDIVSERVTHNFLIEVEKQAAALSGGLQKERAQLDLNKATPQTAAHSQ